MRTNNIFYEKECRSEERKNEQLINEMDRSEK